MNKVGEGALISSIYILLTNTICENSLINPCSRPCSRETCGKQGRLKINNRDVIKLVKETQLETYSLFFHLGYMYYIMRFYTQCV